MPKMIHKPRLMQNDVPNGESNVITQTTISDQEILSTEYWQTEPNREWKDAGIVTAKKGYTWITRWEQGKNYITTKIIDDKGELVGIYWDITSPVTKKGHQFQAYDWYLDIFKASDNKVVLLDEDELEQALKISFITDDQFNTAKKTSEDIARKIKDGNLTGFQQLRKKLKPYCTSSFYETYTKPF